MSTVASWLALAAAGGAGALLRYLVDDLVAARAGRAFPFGTLVVNLSGAFALGVLVGLGPSHGLARIAGTGLLGAYTTFSTWMADTHRLALDRRQRSATINLTSSLILGLVVALLGRALGRALS